MYLVTIKTSRKLLSTEKMSRSGIYLRMGKPKKAETIKNIIAIMAILTVSTLLATLLLSACAAGGRMDLHAPDGGLPDKMAVDSDEDTAKNTKGNAMEDAAEDSMEGTSENILNERNKSDDTIATNPQKNSSHAWDRKSTVFDILDEMSLEEKIGQLFIVGFKGTTPDNALMELIREKHVGGVILFKRNIKYPEKLLRLNNLIKEINSVSNKVPLFISVDEEGGRISRMPERLSKLPSAKSIGEINDENLSYEVGNLLAHLTKAFGFNMNFAPVLDILSNPENTVIGDRAYGTVPEVVVKNGIKVMEGIRDGGVVPVVKHFPGHGDTTVDSHVGLPAVNYDMDRLGSFELVPFQSAINNRADAVMIAHILMTNIDPENPATLSRILITDLLREQMGFDGVVISDDMTMDAIDKNYNIGDAAIKAVLAGCDILLVCHGYEEQLEVINAVNAAVNDGRISEERLNESVCRILMLKDKYYLTDQSSEAPDIEAINKKIDALVTK